MKKRIFQSMTFLTGAMLFSTCVNSGGKRATGGNDDSTSSVAVSLQPVEKYSTVTVNKVSVAN